MRNEKVNHFRFMIFIICTGLFIVMILLLNSEILRRFDIMIITRVQDMISTPLTTALLFITFLGSVKGVVFITIICSITVFYLRNYLLGLYLIISVALGAGAFNRLLKLIFLRDRPEILKLVNESGFSFPSGHAMGYYFIWRPCFYSLSFIWMESIYDGRNASLRYFGGANRVESHILGRPLSKRCTGRLCSW